jgi:AcrR family transcriptional regulator
MDATEIAPGRREKRKLELRQRIEDAGYALFKEQGIDETSIEQICDTADVARRTFYGYYPNKQALLRALSQSRVYTSADAMIEEALRHHSGTRQRVSAMIDYMVKNIAGYKEIDRQLILVGPAGFDSQNHLREVSNSLHGHFRSIFEVGQHNGDIANTLSPDILAHMVVGTINNLMVTWAMNPDYPIFEKLEEVRGLFDQVIRHPQAN